MTMEGIGISREVGRRAEAETAERAESVNATVKQSRTEGSSEGEATNLFDDGLRERLTHGGETMGQQLKLLR